LCGVMAAKVGRKAARGFDYDGFNTFIQFVPSGIRGHILRANPGLVCKSFKKALPF